MKTRVISAITILIILIPIILIGGNLFYIGASIIGLLGFIELLNAKYSDKYLPFIMKVFAVISFLLIMINNWNFVGSFYFADYQRITAVLFLLLIPLIFYNKSKKYTIEDATYLLGIVFFLGITFNQLVRLRIDNLNIFLFVIIITILTDTFAYFTGMLIGKHKLCPSVSPNKTWEGFIGGVLVSTFVGTVFYINLFTYSSVLKIILFVLLLSIAGEIGDMVFSAIKRYFKIKDFSNLIPGHGGVLDRLDSVIFACLIFSYLSVLL